MNKTFREKFPLLSFRCCLRMSTMGNSQPCKFPFLLPAWNKGKGRGFTVTFFQIFRTRLSTNSIFWHNRLKIFKLI